MKLEEVRSYLSKYLHPYFEHKKYLAEGELIYKRPTTFGSSVFIATITGDDEMAYAKFFIGIRHDLVEATLTNGFGLKDYFRNSSYTLLLPWSDINSKEIPHAVPCREYADVKAAGEWGIKFMDEKGFDFLNHYKHLEKLDSIFNDKPELIAKWTRHNYLHRFRAMAIAKLMNRPDYDRLFQMHRQYLESRGFAGKITQKFDTTFARLKRVSFN